MCNIGINLYFTANKTYHFIENNMELWIKVMVPGLDTNSGTSTSPIPFFVGNYDVNLT